VVVVDTARTVAGAPFRPAGIRAELGAGALHLHAVLTLLIYEAIVKHQRIEVTSLKCAERV